MSSVWSLSRLKQSYRSRYYGNRFEDVPDWKPGDNAVSFVNKYLHMTTLNSDSIVNSSSLSINVTSHQSREKKGRDASTSSVNHTPGQSKDVNLKTKKDLPRNPSISEMNENPSFSDEDSDNGHPNVIAKLIEESLTENNDLMGNSEKCTEKLYRSETSVLKEPSSPTSKIHAKKCLIFRDVAAVASKSRNTDRGLRRFSHNVEQLKPQEQEPLNLSKENPNLTNTTFNLGPQNMPIMEEERGFSSKSLVSHFKKKTVSLFSTPVEAKQTPTPEKANSIKATNIQQKSPENKKLSAKRPQNMPIMEEERGFSSKSLVSHFKKKTVSLFSTPVEAKQTPTPEKANSIKATNIQQKSPENKKLSAKRSSAAYEQPPISSTDISDEEFIVEDMSSNNNMFLITVTGKTQPSHNSSVKDKKTALQMTSSESEGTVKKRSKRKEPMSSKKAVKASVQEAAISHTGEVVESGPVAKHAAKQPAMKQLENPLALSQDADLPHLVEEEGNGDQDMSLNENQDDPNSQHAEQTLLNPMLKKVQPTRRSLRRKSNKRGVTANDVLDTKFNIRSRKGTGNTKMMKSAKKTKMSKSSKKKNLRIQSQNGRLEMDNRNKKTVETEKDLHPRRRKAKVKHISTPCPAEHSSEASVFQSGPVLRPRAFQVPKAVKPIACDLDSTETDSEDHVSSEVENDAAITSEPDGQEQEISSEDHNPIDSGNLQELFTRYSIVFDPATKSDVLIECVSQGDKSTFTGDDACTSWNSFNNRLFNTGKLVIAPKKFTKSFVSTSIMMYYIEQGQVQLILHKSERILKAGDFFFVPPGNRSKIINLQDMEAVLVFNKLNVFS